MLILMVRIKEIVALITSSLFKTHRIRVVFKELIVTREVLLLRELVDMMEIAIQVVLMEDIVDLEAVLVVVQVVTLETQDLTDIYFKINFFNMKFYK